MTLSRQLLLSGLLVLISLFVGTNYFVVKNTQSFLKDQLASHSQDTATALGLCLTLVMKNNDAITAGRIVDAIWDRGYYRFIEVQGSDGKPIVERSGGTKLYDVPQWFIEKFHIDTEKKEALVMDGWRKVGKVIIESNPGFAYKQIWTTFIDSLEWLIMTSAIAGVLGVSLLYIILRPLRGITAQAAAICNQQFSIQEKLPWTIDLRQVVEAMNNMSRRLKNLFEEQAKASEKLREQAYKDPVTKLGNRAYFDLQFDYLLQDQERGGGMLLLIELNDFKGYNEKFGYQQGDRFLQNTAKELAACCDEYPGSIVTHAKGASFFVILPGKTKETAEEVAQKICDAFTQFRRKELCNVDNVGNVGMSAFVPGESKKNIFSQVDMSLRSAQTQGPNRWFGLTGVKPQETHGASEWAAIFSNVIKNNKVILHFQETKMLKNPDAKTYETLMRIFLDDSNIIAAGVFMPMAEQLNQMTALDKLVIDNVINKILLSKIPYNFSVNISPRSIEDDQFKNWLYDKMKSLGKKANQLIVELPEHAVIARLNVVREFFKRFSQLGGKTAIDHYGKSFSSFSYLYNLKVNILKIEGGFIRKINENDANQFFIRSLVDIAHSLDILVIAEAVESAEEFEALTALKVDGVQGYFIGKPTALQT